MKNKIFTLFMVIISCPALFGQVPTNGLIGFYPFTGNANDQIATSSNGTVYGATLVSDRFGNQNSAYSFNGSSNYISIPTTKFLVNNYTYSFWLKPASSSSTPQYIMSIGSPAISGAEGYAAGISGNKGIYYGSYAVNGSNLGKAMTTPPTLNEWTHVCITRSSSQFSLYIDGKRVDSVSTGGSNPQYGTGSYAFLVGTRFNKTYYFNGSLDDLRIYNRAVTETEAKALYNETNTNSNDIAYANSIKIYPNPTIDKITIENGDFAKSSGYTVKILNSIGAEVFSSLVSQEQFVVDLSKFGSTAGIYFVHVIDSNFNTLKIQKLVLQ